MAWTELDHDVHITVHVLAVDESGPKTAFRTAIEMPEGFGDRAAGTLLVYAGTTLLEQADGE